MERTAFDRMKAHEDHHWWFKSRRKILSVLIRPLIGKDASILEVGCGTGGNLSLLSGFGTVDAFEFDEQARQTARLKSGLAIPFGALPNEIPFKGRTYDLICLLDVLEHIEDDQAALKALLDHLSEDGKVFLTVPAFQWMWSRHDEQHHHFRRYTRKSLSEVAQASGYKLVSSSYFNTLLFPLAIIARGLKTLTRNDTPDDEMPSRWVNSLLEATFSLERHLIRRVPLPFGLSLAMVLMKKGSN